VHDSHGYDDTVVVMDAWLSATTADGLHDGNADPPCQHGRARDLRRVVLLLIAIVAALFSAATGGWAHSVLEESEPAADSIISSPPAEVVMWFNEPLIEDGSHATVIAPDGREFTDVEIDADAQEMRVALDAGGASGAYVVDWQTVSPVDGHTWQGSFEFQVESAGTDAERVPADRPDEDADSRASEGDDDGTDEGTPGEPRDDEAPPSSATPGEPGDAGQRAEAPATEPRRQASASLGGPRLLAGVGRAMEYLGWLAVVGWLTLAALARSVRGGWEPHRLLPWVGLAAVGAALTVSSELLQAGGGSLATGIQVLLPTTAGGVRLARVGVALFAVGIVAGASVGNDGAVPHRRSRMVVTVLALAALVLLAASGHAASSGGSLLVGAGHLATAGVWAGTIVAMAANRPPGGWRGELGRDLVKAFVPYGLTTFGATVLLGLVRAVQELSRLPDLWTSTYGQVLVAKVLLVLAMVPLSWRAWRRGTPLPRAEGVLAIGAIVLAAGLAVLGPPAPSADRSVPGAEADPVAAGLPQPDDLTLGGDAGSTVVGLTLRPARPGDNHVIAYLVPSGGIDEADDLETTLRVDGGDPLEMKHCGVACRTTTATLEGDERLEIAVDDGEQQHTATFELPALPAPDGTELLDRAEQRMNQLRTLRYDEVFGPHQPPTRSTWQIVAPDRLYGVITRDDDHRETLRIEDRRWRRDGPDEPWEGGEPGGLRVTANRFIWEEEGRTAVRIVGSDTVDGVETDVVSFFLPLSEQLPVWYRLWIDGDDLIRQAEMRTQGHFMDHRYYDFDEDIEIEPPS